MTFTTCCTNYVNFNYFLRTLQVTRISIHKHLFISLFLFTVTTGLFRETFSNIYYLGIFETYSIYFGQGTKEFFGKVTYHQNNQHFDMTFSFGAFLLEKCFCRVQVNAMAIVSKYILSAYGKIWSGSASSFRNQIWKLLSTTGWSCSCTRYNRFKQYLAE